MNDTTHLPCVGHSYVVILGILVAVRKGRGGFRSVLDSVGEKG